MTLWLQSRGVLTTTVAALVSVLALLLPGSAMRATPSPAGATLMVAAFLSLSVPIAVGWGCSRGDPLLESVARRQVWLLDLGLALSAVLAASAVAMALSTAGIAQAGDVAARDGVVYLGMMLLFQPHVGWRNAALVPVAYVLAVALLGRGGDIDHPQAWALVAAPASDPGSWLVAAILLVAASALYILASRT